MSIPEAKKRFSWDNVASHEEASSFLQNQFKKTDAGRTDIEAVLMLVRKNVVVRSAAAATPAQIEEFNDDPYNIPRQFCPTCTGYSTACQLSCCAHVAFFYSNVKLYNADTPLKRMKRGRPKKAAAPDRQSKGSDFSGRGGFKNLNKKFCQIPFKKSSILEILWVVGLGPIQNQWTDTCDTVRNFDWEDLESYEGGGGIEAFVTSATKQAEIFLHQLQDGAEVHEKAGGRPALILVLDFCQQIIVRSKKVTLMEGAKQLEEKVRAALASLNPEPRALHF